MCGNSAYVLPCTRWHCVMHITPLGCKICTQRVAIVGGTDRTFPGGSWDWHCETLRRSFQPSSEGAKPLWKHTMAPVCLYGPTCSWLECIYYIMEEGCPARSPVFWFSMSEKAPASTLNVKTRGGNGRRSARVCVFKQTGRLRLHQSQRRALGSRRGSSQLKRPVMRPI